MVTLLAPTDAGIQTTLTALNLTADQVLAQPARISDILLYHVLPSQISVGPSPPHISSLSLGLRFWQNLRGFVKCIQDPDLSASPMSHLLCSEDCRGDIKLSMQ